MASWGEKPISFQHVTLSSERDASILFLESVIHGGYMALVYEITGMKSL
jgi:hypothetical protein